MDGFGKDALFCEDCGLYVIAELMENAGPFHFLFDDGLSVFIREKVIVFDLFLIHAQRQQDQHRSDAGAVLALGAVDQQRSFFLHQDPEHLLVCIIGIDKGCMNA